MDTAVHVDYLPEVERYVICRDDNNELVKSYNREADAMFDYAALRNGEVTIAEVSSNGKPHPDHDEQVTLIDVYIYTYQANNTPSIYNADCTMISNKWDYFLATQPNWLSSESDWRPWVREKANRIKRHILLKYHYKNKSKPCTYEIFDWR